MDIRRRGAAVLGVLAVVLILAGLRAWVGSGAVPTSRERLVGALGDAMPFTARLSGGFAPPRERAPRTETTAAPTLSPEARIALAEMEMRAAADTAPEAQADLGIAYLIQGDVDHAIQTLEGVVGQLETAAIWLDLSASYLVKAKQAPTRAFEFLARALEAAGKANAIQHTPEGLFNQTLALQGLAPMLGERISWEPYLVSEQDSRWAGVAMLQAAAHPVLVDPAASAADRVGRLRAALESRERSQLDTIVRESPEAASDHFNRELLPAWAHSEERGDRTSASELLSRAMVLADAIGAVTGDLSTAKELTLLARGGRGLASAHLRLAQALTAYRSNAYSDARRLFEAAGAALRPSGSAYANWADFYVAVIAFQERHLEDADTRLETIQRRARARGQRSLLADARRLHGLVYVKQWRIGEAVAAFRESAALFEQSGERANAVGAYHHLADTYRTLGERHLTWQFIARTLEAQSFEPAAIRRYLSYYNAALFAASQQLYEVAVRLQSSAVREAMRTRNEVAIVESLTQRAVILRQRNDEIAATADLDAAQRRLPSVPDGPLKQYLQSELAVLTAELRAPSAENLAALQQAIHFFSASEPGRTPRLWLALAEQRLVLGARADTIEALEEGIARLEQQQAGLGDAALKISFFDSSWSLFERLLQLQFEQRDYEQAFVTAERARSRLLRTSVVKASSAQVAGIADLQRVLPDRVTLVYFVSLPDQLKVWVISRERQALVGSGATATQLGRLVAQHREAIVTGRDSTAAPSLYQHVMAPVAKELSSNQTVVIVPDGALQQLPFATLRDPASGRYLIEDHAVLIAPSATVFVHAIARGGGAFSSALLVGNPITSAAALPAAEREVRDVAGFYRSADVLTGSAATKRQFVQRAPNYDVVHFGGHGYANAEYPLLSRLAFAGPGDQEDSLFAHEISSLTFARTQLVVLAACSTAGGVISRGEGVVSVAWPFLAAGVPLVVASQWDVDDEATRALFVAFHQAVAETRDPVRALRTAQLSLLHSGNDEFEAPASWGAFVALGTLSPAI
jgi:CHAT domain-containing protein